MTLKDFGSALNDAFADWNKHSAPRLGAALSFYTILSLSPLVILTVAVLGYVFNHSTAERQILQQIQGLTGSAGGNAVHSILTSVRKPSSSLIGAIVGALTLLFGASGVFGELRCALNTIWDVRPAECFSVIKMLRERLFSFGMVLSIGFLLMISLVLSTALAAIGRFFTHLLPVPSALLVVLNAVISFVGIAVLFGLIFKYVPETVVRWKDIRLGAVVTALLFTFGKTLIGLYLGRSSVGSAYGAAGSVIVVIVWVYYSAQIFLFGAEFTHTTSQRGSGPTQFQNQKRLRDAA